MKRILPIILVTAMLTSACSPKNPAEAYPTTNPESDKLPPVKLEMPHKIVLEPNNSFIGMMEIPPADSLINPVLHAANFSEEDPILPNLFVSPDSILDTNNETDPIAYTLETDKKLIISREEINYEYTTNSSSYAIRYLVINPTTGEEQIVVSIIELNEQGEAAYIGNVVDPETSLQLQ